MPAMVQETNVDGILTVEVVYTEPAVRALESIARLLPEHSYLEAALHIAPEPITKCDICGGDARWHAETWGFGVTVPICDDHMKTHIDKYHSFTRI